MMMELLQYLRNWFATKKIFGNFEIRDGNIKHLDLGKLDDIDILKGQYVRIIGSALNDNVWKFPDYTMKNESFNGAIWILSIPKAVENIAKEIEEWQTKYGNSVSSPWQSESYSRGAYSRSKGSAADSSISWKTAFENRLAPWRKL